MMNWAPEWYRPGKVPPAEIAAMYAYMILAGLVAGTPPAARAAAGCPDT
jgi:hypothetical protein